MDDRLSVSALCFPGVAPMAVLDMVAGIGAVYTTLHVGAVARAGPAAVRSYGEGIGVGVEVGSCTTTSVRLVAPPKVHKIAPIASRSTAATPIERINIGESVLFGAVDSSGEPHSGHRNS